VLPVEPIFADNQMKSIFIVLALTSMLPAQTTFSDFLTFDGPIHHDTPNGWPITGGGEDIIKDDSLVRIDGDNIFVMARISDIGSSGVPNRGVSEKHILFFLSVTKQKDQLLPNPKGFDILDPSITGPANLTDQSLGIVVALNKNPISVKPLPSALAFGFPPPITSKTHHWEMTLNAGSFAVTEGVNGFSRAAFTVSSSAFQAKWLPVDVSDLDGNIHLGDVTLDVMYLLGPASQDEQDAGWTNGAETDFIMNPIK